MAAISFSSMVPDLSAFLQGCPNPAIERTLRKIATDLCQRARVWRATLPDLLLTPGVSVFTPAPAEDYAEFVDVVSARLVVGGVSRVLPWVAYAQAANAYPNGALGTGTPTLLTTATPGRLTLAPTPDAADTLSLYVTLRPTATAVSWDAQMYREFHRALFHGTMSELQMMPDRSWSDAAMSAYHGKQWTYLLSAARDQAERDYNSGPLSVQMRPFA